MTVRELIEELSRQSPDDVVVINMDRNELANSREVGKVVSEPRTLYKPNDFTFSATSHDLFDDEECAEYGYRRVSVVNLVP